VLTDDDAAFAGTVERAAARCRETRQPYALIAPKGVMADPDKPNNTDAVYPMSREEAIEVILDHMPADTVYSATTGRATRELFFQREKRGETRARDFLNVGSMGHASSVALGIALAKPERPVVALDGDAAAIMHLGALTMVSKVDAPNFLHVVLNNGAHESVGGQPSAGQLVDFTKIAEACGYQTVGHAVTSREELIEAVDSLRGCGRAAFIDCRIHKGLSRKLPPILFDHRQAIDALIDELNGKR
jgi:phosphonopyruvate decarboxylase